MMGCSWSRKLEPEVGAGSVAVGAAFVCAGWVAWSRANTPQKFMTLQIAWRKISNILCH